MSVGAPRPDQVAAEAQAPVLSVAGLTTSFMRERQSIPVVRDVSFEIAPRETVAIVGESGSGKSVTALSIMRLIPKESGRSEGRIMLSGRDLLTLPEADMKHIRGNDVAMIFQEPMTSLNPVLTIGFQIAEALIQHRGLSRAAAEAETIRLLDRVRIPAAKSRFHEHPHRFSGGMRQRVMIAMALACRPKLLIADEPTTALDVTIQAQILELLKELQQEEGMSILFITHDMGVVAEIADRTVVMYGGQAVETDATSRIFAAPSHPYTRSLLAAVPRLGSMDGRTRPMRFPIVDKVTGTSDEPVETPDTVSSAERPLLEVSNLTTRFPIRSGLFGKVSGRVHAVENISFTLRAGETLALVGESGCGKSTTGRSILKLTEPDAGTVLIDGQDVLAMNGRTLRDFRRHMQIVFQDPFASLNPRMSVGTAIAAPLLANGLATAAQARDKVADLLVRVGLTADMAARFPHEFSGGQRQRICIARRACARTKIDCRGRSGLRARCLGQGASRQFDARPSGQHGARLSLHFPRHCGGRADEPSRRGDVSRRDRRDRPAGRLVRQPAASLHQETDGRRSRARPLAPRHQARGRQRRDQKPGARGRLPAAGAAISRSLARPCRAGLGRGVVGLTHQGTVRLGCFRGTRRCRLVLLKS
ncbi:peptide/nickel transport system ATP-binding protein [Bradyrhizobium sp. GM24.11]